MNKPADTSYPLHELIASRWSPRAFTDRDVSSEQLGSLFEAARWSASCFNAQPWRYLVAKRSDKDAFDTLAACLVEANAVWATRAPVLAMSIAQLSFDHNGKPNRWAPYDTGNATAALSLQAESMGLSIHQMGGFDADKARELCKIPDGFDPMAMIAIGYRADPDTLPDELAERERAPRERKALDSLVFGATWESRHPFA